MKKYFKILILILVSLAILIPFSSTFPDGLETVAENVNTEEPEQIWKGLFPDYSTQNINNSYLSTIIAGFSGVLLVLCVSFLFGKQTNRQV